MTRLLDEVERTDASPAWPGEDSFSFLNRVDGIVWQRQRELMECWYRAFPDEGLDQRRRFRSRDPRQHYPAWWELYTHALLSALGYELTIHPDVPGSSGHPDFLAERGGSSFYVEAVTVFSGIVSPSRTSRALIDIEDSIARMDASTYWVSLRVDQVGAATPSLRRVRSEISRWVATLDPEEVPQRAPTDPNSWKAFSFSGGWVISLRPGVWSPERRDCPDNRFVGMRTGFGGFVDDVPKLRNALRRKGKHYGTPDKPLLVAALAANGFVNDHAVVDALFGSQAVRVNINSGESHIVRSPDGVWISSRGIAMRRISAVLLGAGILPHTVASAWPTLWYHFDPAFELTDELPFETKRVVDSALRSDEAQGSPGEAFGLPDDWPGPEPRFNRCEHRPGDHRATQIARV